MFKRTEIVELIYEGVVENPSKNPTDWEDSNRAGNIRKNGGEATSYNDKPDKGVFYGNSKTRDTYNSGNKLMGKHCMINGAGHSSVDSRVCQTLAKNGPPRIHQNTASVATVKTPKRLIALYLNK